MEINNSEERILAVDYGEKRIGIAITDPLIIFAYPLKTIQNDSKFWSDFLSIFEEYNIVKLIVGYPLKESGEESTSSKMVLKFKSELEKRISIPVELVDERYSSEIAKQNILQSVSSKKKRRDKGLVDKNAAAVILQDYLDSLK
ncbi:Holliday junction resolvase RuvX [Bacteroidota bacterium]